MSVTIHNTLDLQALLATMKSAKERDTLMCIWGRDIKTVEDAIATIEGIRAVEYTDADEMDDFIRAILADNNPRTDEPFATIAKWIRRMQKSVVLTAPVANGTRSTPSKGE